MKNKNDGGKNCTETATFIIGVIGSVLGIALMYQLSLFFSDRLIKALVFEEKIKSFQFYIKKYSTGIIGLFFVLPVFPDIVIGLGAAALKVKFY